MAYDLLYGTAATAVFYPDSVLSSPSAQVIAPDGTVKESPTPSVDTTSTTIASATSSSVFVLTSASGVAVGRKYLVTADGWSALCEVADLSSTTVTLVEALPETPANGDTFAGVRTTVAIAAGSLDDYSTNWRVRLYKAQDEWIQTFHVVRHKFAPAADEEDVRALVNSLARSDHFPAEVYQNIAVAADLDVRRRIIATGRYPFLFGDSDAFQVAGKIAVRLQLIDHGIIQGGWDVEAYERYYRQRLEMAVGEVVQSLTPYDSTNDDSYEDEATKITNVRLHL